MLDKNRAPSERTRVKRAPKRADYRKETVLGILRDCYLGTISYAVDGEVRAIPMAVWLWGERLCIHGSTASRLLRELGDGRTACIVSTRLDGLVLARSAFHHSMSYRSVVVYGVGEVVEDPVDKRAALDAFMDHVVPGRKDAVRPPSDKEMAATAVLAYGLDEAVAKVRIGEPIDDDADYALPVWAGQVPIERVLGEPIADPRCDNGLPPPTLSGLTLPR
jgi:hypothetical protein